MLHFLELLSAIRREASEEDTFPCLLKKFHLMSKWDFTVDIPNEQTLETTSAAVSDGLADAHMRLDRFYYDDDNHRFAQEKNLTLHFPPASKLFPPLLIRSRSRLQQWMLR
jgi:hypothetical protein